MCRIGPNRCFWPARDDVCLYSKDRLVPAPFRFPIMKDPELSTYS